MTVYRYTRDNLPGNDAAQPFNPQPSSAPRPSTHLVAKLVALLNGDRPAADRLVALEQKKHLGRATDWYWQEAIDNLSRDRGH
jgi:hypothetical protein